jgi:hypothetical protein
MNQKEKEGDKLDTKRMLELVRLGVTFVISIVRLVRIRWESVEPVEETVWTRLRERREAMIERWASDGRDEGERWADAYRIAGARTSSPFEAERTEGRSKER